MAMNNVTQLMSGVNQQQNAAAPAAQPAAASAPAAAVTLPGDIGTDFGSAGVFTPAEGFNPDMARVQELWSNHEARVDSFRRMVETLLNQQAERQGLSQGWSIRDIEITPEMRAEANEMLGEGGYFSVEETASRILDFAVALSGGDPSRIDLLQGAVERAFGQAERMFGGELPQISHDTLAAIREGFDQWREGGVENIALLNR